MLTRDWQRKIHERLLVDDPTAPAELAEKLLPAIIRRLKKKYVKISDPDILDEAAATALIEYVKKPSQFDPTRLALEGFLTMAADRDVRNALAKTNRRKMKEISTDHVEQWRPTGNTNLEDQILGHLNAKTIRCSIANILNDKELEVFDLMTEGVRSTNEFSRILGVDQLPWTDQQREVKRCKDRIKKKLQRRSKEIFPSDS